MVNKTSRIVAFIVLLLGFITLSMRAQAQNVVRKGNAFIEQSGPSKGGEATKTSYTYTDKKGEVDTVYISTNGNAFVWKTSKKTGNKYRKYLPKVTEQLGTKKSEKK